MHGLSSLGANGPLMPLTTGEHRANQGSAQAEELLTHLLGIMHSTGLVWCQESDSAIPE